MQCPDWVFIRVKRFKKDGIVALRDLPRLGKAPQHYSKTLRKKFRRDGGVRSLPLALGRGTPI